MWKLQEDGASDRVSQGGAFGTYNLTAAGSPSAVQGVSGNACNFDGVNDFLTNTSTVFEVESDNVSILASMWVRFDNLSDTQQIIEFGDRSWQLSFFGGDVFLSGLGNYLRLDVNGGGQFVSDDNIITSIDKFYHIVIYLSANHRAIIMVGWCTSRY